MKSEHRCPEMKLVSDEAGSVGALSAASLGDARDASPRTKMLEGFIPRLY